MKITLMHISSSAIEGVRKALADIYHIKLMDPPQVTTDYVHHEPHVHGTSSDYIATFKVRHQTLGGSGYVAIFMSKGAAEKLAETASPGKTLSAEDIRGEYKKFCAMIVDVFSQRLYNLRQGQFDVTSPELHDEGVDEKIKGVDINQKHVVLFTDDDKRLLMLETGYQGEKLAK